ncbi:MAG: hypothetical protein CMC99_06955, partial [Flavobacteriales bacterium]|nr:hypothetical protein [Flavobacteriales bacterium]
MYSCVSRSGKTPTKTTQQMNCSSRSSAAILRPFFVALLSAFFCLPALAQCDDVNANDICDDVEFSCIADYDFGDAALGLSPNPELGEQFEPGVVGESYEDILHILLPQYVLALDPTLPFTPTTPLDSASLSSVVLVDLNDSLSTTSLDAIKVSMLPSLVHATDVRTASAQESFKGDDENRRSSSKNSALSNAQS